jgi:tight adherence protein C
MTTIFYGALGFTLFCVIALMFAPLVMRPTAEVQRFFDLVKNNRPERRKVGNRQRFEEGLFSLVTDLRSALGMTIDAKSQERLYAAGYRGTLAPDLFFAAQFLTPLCLVIIASFTEQQTAFWIFIALVLGYLLPNIWLSIAMSRRKDTIRRGLPDAIDLLVICVDAGLGIDQALIRVGQELLISHPEIHAEFSRVHLEQRAGAPRLEAWKNLANRTRIKEIAVFVNMLTQTDRFGTPIAKALGGFAQDLRSSRRQRTEEAAAKTKIKIIFPLVFCIFPCLFVVLLTPAILSIMTNFKSVAR